MHTLLRRTKRHLKRLFVGEFALTPVLKVPTEFHGTEYGGWAVRRGSLDHEARVISVGVGEDASFDLGLIETYGCTVHAFDPTPKSVRWVADNIRDPRFVFAPCAVADHDGTLRLFLPKNDAHVSASCRQSTHTKDEFFDAPALRLSSLLSKLSFDHVDVLKLDIEGAEYGVIRDGLASGVIARVDQLLIEFHHHLSGFTLADTKGTVDALRAAGLHIAWVSRAGHEVLFVRKD